MKTAYNHLSRFALTQTEAPATWELVDELPSFGPRMLTSAELAQMQGFGPISIITESCPCASHATPMKPRIA
jgi:hypothetical protein